MLDVDSEFSWVAEFSEFGVRTLDDQKKLGDPIDLQAAVGAELSIDGAPFSTGPAEVVHLDAVDHGGLGVEFSLEVDGEGSGETSGLFAAGVGVLAVCSIAIAALGFRLDTGSLQTESAGPLQTASAVYQPGAIKQYELETAGTSSERSTSTSQTNNAAAQLAKGTNGGSVPLELASTDSTNVETAPTVGNKSASTVRGAAAQAAQQRSKGSSTRSSQLPTDRPAVTTGQTTTVRGTVGQAVTTSTIDRVTTTGVRSTSTTPNRQTTTVVAEPDDVIDLPGGGVLQVGLEPSRDRPGYGAAVLASDTEDLDLLIADRVTDQDGKGIRGVAVDVFTATSSGLRDDFVSSAETDSGGNYQLEVQEGAGDRDDCYVLVFVAPEGIGFESSGQYREVQLCAPFSKEDLPIVRTVDIELTAPRSGASRSVVLTGGPVYLRGNVASPEQAAELEDRFKGTVTGSVTSDYHIVAEGSVVARSLDDEVDSTPDLAEEDRVYFRGRDEELFAIGTAEPTETLERLVSDLVSILEKNPNARLQIVVGADLDLGETVPMSTLINRAEVVVNALLSNAIEVDRLDATYTNGRLFGRELHGESMSNQIEFVLIWS